MALPSTINDGFLGFSAQGHVMSDMRLRAAILNPTANAVKKSGVVKFNAGKLEHVGVTGTNEVQRITITGAPTGGSFTVTFGGVTSAAIPYNATAAQVRTILEAMSTIGGGNVLTTGGPFPGSFVEIEFTGLLGAQNVATLTTTDAFTGGAGPASAVTTPTAGVLGVVSDAKIAGFSAEHENGPLSNWPAEFGVVKVDLGLPFGGIQADGTFKRELKYYPARAGACFFGSVTPNVALARTVIDTTCDIGWLPREKLFFVRVGSATNALVKIIGVVEDEVGKNGGRVLFTVLDGDSQLES